MFQESKSTGTTHVIFITMFSVKEKKKEGGKQQPKCQTTGNNYINYSLPILGTTAWTFKGIITKVVQEHGKILTRINENVG